MGRVSASTSGGHQRAETIDQWMEASVRSQVLKYSAYYLEGVGANAADAQDGILNGAALTVY